MRKIGLTCLLNYCKVGVKSSYFVILQLMSEPRNITYMFLLEWPGLGVQQSVSIELSYYEGHLNETKLLISDSVHSQGV